MPTAGAVTAEAYTICLSLLEQQFATDNFGSPHVYLIHRQIANKTKSGEYPGGAAQAKLPAPSNNRYVTPFVARFPLYC